MDPIDQTAPRRQGVGLFVCLAEVGRYLESNPRMLQRFQRTAYPEKAAGVALLDSGVPAGYSSGAAGMAHLVAVPARAAFERTMRACGRGPRRRAGFP